MLSPNWTPEEDAVLRAGVAARRSYSEIALSLGRTKDMVSGRAKRVGAHKPGLPCGGKLAAPPTPETSGCKYIEGEPDWLHRGDSIFCGAKVLGRSRYCAEHHRRVWTPAGEIKSSDPAAVPAPRSPP